MCGENRLSGLYSERRKLATGAKNILGTAKSGIRMIGQANTFANKTGVSANTDARKYENTHAYEQAMIAVYIYASMYSASVRRPI